MKLRWKGYIAIAGGILVLLFAAAAVLVYAVYFGYYHVNGFRAAKYPIHGVDVSHYQGDIDWDVLTAQAENFIETVEAFDGMLPPVVDVEFYGNKEAGPPDPEEVRPQLQTYLESAGDICGLDLLAVYQQGTAEGLLW